MPNISNRGQIMPASPIRKLVPFAEKAKIRGMKIYHLNIGQPDIITPPEMIEAVKKTDLQVIEYSHSAGNESYRRKLVDYYNSCGIKLNHHNIMITTGGSEAIQFGMLSCLDAEDEIIVPEPLYANYVGFSTAGNIHIKPITSSIDNGYALPPIEEFEKLITPKTKAILICNPNNPTGYLYSKSELQQLRDIVIKHDLFLFADEVYREFVYDGAEHFSVLNLDGLDEHVVLMDSISKRYSACGARIGALVSRNNKFMETALKFAQARLSPPTLEQILAEAFTEVPATYFDSVKSEYLIRRDLLVQRLNAMKGVKCPTPGGAFYAMAQLPIDDSDVFCQWLLEEFNMNNETVMLAPATGFYSSPGLGKQEVRIAYVLKQKDLNSAMDCLEQALKVYPGRTV
ncbi:MAG: pyridoxal phosphate-dependent aminotransferase [Bacteroidetes bacterium]|nr:pyridoxal phosphate-dependent aminotransferase [Bacteroidota bacterium]MBP7398330.1 pyridoxal phosphate-dependent aminotransferase [Chitinophagales bacterium]MBK8487118.1 pyridoxal phosphate-dependent aminotransferase [Bacteroidota bacterium]MBK8680504.1 pyridoxal phosphate-dependent aminotransferase [Bacteroidota bacterium]MBP8753487.1 pyridoxal phosphate-dependent aminotransferase [Chitinophagales bacterium]